MRVAITFGLATILTAVLVLVSLKFFRDPLPPIIVSVLLWPLWVLTMTILSTKNKGNIDLVAMQNYNNLNQIRQNTDYMRQNYNRPNNP